MYHVLVSKLVQSVLAYVRRHEMLKAGDRVAVAVSGGADSVALLRLLAELRGELGIVLAVVHFNHKLRAADSDQDERFVAALAQQLGLELHSESTDVAGWARKRHLSLEAAARKLRYEYFERLLRRKQLNCIATAHTVNDQAETVLLKLVRGAGTRGLAGIYPKLAAAGGASIIRPLLGIRRKDIAVFLSDIQQPWREDKSNRDLRHSRNRVRHGILPRLERHLNPAVYETLSEIADLARAEENYWTRQLDQLLPTLWRRAGNSESSSGTLNRTALAALPLALQRRVVRGAAESLGLRLEFRQVEEILETASFRQCDSQRRSVPSMLLPHDWRVSRKKDELYFELQDVGREVFNYQYPLPIPGSVAIPELGSRFEIKLIGRNAIQGYNPQHLFDPELLTDGLAVRNWRPGDRFWPAHSKAPKKVKELLQDRQVSGPERKLWPVVVSGPELVWLRGFPASARFEPPRNAQQVLLLQELALPDRS